MQQLDPRRSSQSSFGSARAREASQITTEADRLDGWTLPAGEHSALPWWRWGVTYQIYPLSFQDTNGDGKGDLPGVLLRLEHLSWLGVSAVWLSPVYCSPMEDFGYDIADFTDVDPLFGTRADLDRLTERLHARGIRLILDFVPNHTSDRHPWFQDSRSARDNPKRDWFIWRDPGPDGGPPNNWLSRFGGSAWEWDASTGQYYYHAFLKSQPDLNWRNPEVRRAMHDVLRFWLRRDIDGFRIDAAAVLAEDALLRDDPLNPEFDENTPPPERFKRVCTDARPDSLTYLSELREVTDAFPDRVLLGEVDTSPEKVADFYGKDGCRLHLPLNYRLLDTDWKAEAVECTIGEYLDSLPGGACPNWLIGSHDKPCIASRIGPEQARVAAMLLLTLPGMVAIYAGDEIGMRDVEIPSREARDPFERRVPGYGLNRDPHRAPMRWNTEPQAGFTTGEPWLPIGDEIETRNVESQRSDPRSLLNLYRSLIALRRSEPVLQAGSYEPLGRFGEALVYQRRLGACEILVALNFGSVPQNVPMDHHGTVRLSTALDRSNETIIGTLRLHSNEGVILERRISP
jgi:alpha-glucosidase